MSSRRGRGFSQFHRDARLFLVVTLVGGAASSLYWIDFNLYLASLGLSTATIGLVSTIAALAGALAAFPVGAASDRFGRRTMLAGGMFAGLVALVGLLTNDALVPIVAFASLWAVGQQVFQIVAAPFLTEHSEPDHRNELFAVQFAIQSGTSVVAAVIGGVGAVAIASAIGLDTNGPGTYRVIIVIMIVLLVAALATVGLLADDRPRVVTDRRLVRVGEPAAFPRDPRRPRMLLGVTVRDRGRLARLVLPGFLISIGAGQLIPFLNVFLSGKFGLDLASLNGVFAFTSLGTVLAILAQPTLARRFGRIASVVIVQTASIPFLAVLGFSPVLWTVVLAMAVRNSLMNASNPIFNAFAMEHVAAVERTTLSAAISVLWQIGWVLGGSWYSLLQATLGFERGYAVNFVTIMTLYAIATGLYWVWFRAADRRERALAAG